MLNAYYFACVLMCSFILSPAFSEIVESRRAEEGEGMIVVL